LTNMKGLWLYGRTAGELGLYRFFGRVRDFHDLGDGTLSFGAGGGVQGRRSVSDPGDRMLAIHRAHGYLRYRKGDGLDLSLHAGSVGGDGLVYVYAGDERITGALNYWVMGKSELAGCPQELDDANVGGYPTSIAIDGNDVPHIAYIDNNNEDLKYLKLDGTSTPRTLETEGRVSACTAMAIDADGIPHISYYVTTDWSYLRYLKLDGVSVPVSITVLPLMGTGDKFKTSIVLDCNGVPHITYYDESSQDLMYVHGPFTAPLIPERVDKL